ncbi:MAG TPA: DUF4157 domain-containing protein [Nostocaceae cyanobacterium]|nr:DUF4157 domain-containing protein [Nostocaceae cyanobacterium]
MAYQWGKRNNSHGNNSDQDRPNQFASRPFIFRTEREQETPEPRKLSDESSSQLRLSSITRPDSTVQTQTTPQIETEPEQEEQKQESNHTIKLSSPENPEQPNNNETNPAATIQTKLTIGAPGDKYEQEADTVARKVMSENVLQLSYWPEPKKPKNIVPKPKLSLIQQKAQEEGNNPTPNLENQLNSKKGGGSPLDNQTRSFMESRFGADFSSVRVHTDTTAVQMNQELGAQAFTHGSDIFFSQGKSPGQNELTAHELTHVVQQGGAKTINRKIEPEVASPKSNYNKISRYTHEKEIQRLPAKKLSETDADFVSNNKSQNPTEQSISNHNSATKLQPKQLDTDTIQRQSLNISSAEPRIQRNWLSSIIEGSTEWTIKQTLGEQVLNVLQRAGDVLRKIIQDPVRFCSNLITSIRNGFTRFQENISTHLTNGLMGWLFGALSGAGLVLPNEFDAKGLVSITLQVLGLTYDNFRGRLARRIGDDKVGILEQSYDFLQRIASGGLTEAWEDICQEVGDIKDMILGGIKDWVINTIITRAITRLITMFNPVGGLIESARAIYNTVMFFIERAQQIAALVDSIFNSINKIVEGDTDSASNYIEQTMGRTIPVIISFLARLLGLSGVSDRIKAVIQRIQAPINRALDKLEDKIADRARTLLDRNQRQNQAPQQSAATPVTAPAPQSQPPSSVTPPAPTSTSTPTTTAPAPQSPSSPATTPTRTQTPPSQSTPNRTTTPGQQNPSSPATQTANQTPAQQQNQPAQQNTSNETANHRALARQAVSELEQTRGENQDYETLRREKETQARQIEQNYTRRLRQGIKLTVKFEDAARDKQDGKLDFKVTIAPNDTNDKGSIPVSEKANQLKKAVEKLRIVGFMKAMGKNETVEGITRNDFQELWDDDTQKIGTKKAKDWVKNKFRKAARGQHEWIPCNLIAQVIERTASTNEFIEGDKWIDFQHGLRSPTKQIIFNKSKAIKIKYREEEKEEDKLVLQGHTKSVYLYEEIPENQQTKYSPEFHKALESAFTNSKNITDCIRGIRRVFEDWVWKGDEVSEQEVHPEMMCYSKKAKTNWSDITKAQADNYKTIKDKIDKYIQ